MTLFRHRTCTYLHGRADRSFLVLVSNGQVAALGDWAYCQSALVRPPVCVWCRKLTLCDGLERCVKRGGGDEKAAAAYCCALLLTQLGACDDSTELYHQVSPLLTFVLTDGSAAVRARSAVRADVCSYNIQFATIHTYFKYYLHSIYPDMFIICTIKDVHIYRGDIWPNTYNSYRDAWFHSNRVYRRFR